jgi:hypothetical protein
MRGLGGVSKSQRGSSDRVRVVDSELVLVKHSASGTTSEDRGRPRERVGVSKRCAAAQEL